MFTVREQSTPITVRDPLYTCDLQCDLWCDFAYKTRPILRHADALSWGIACIGKHKFVGIFIAALRDQAPMWCRPGEVLYGNTASEVAECALAGWGCAGGTFLAPVITWWHRRNAPARAQSFIAKKKNLPPLERTMPGFLEWRRCKLRHVREYWTAFLNNGSKLNASALSFLSSRH